MRRGVKFPKKAFLLTFVEACGVDVEADRRWEQAWDRLAGQYLNQAGQAQTELDQLRQEVTQLREQLGAPREAAESQMALAVLEEARQQLVDARREAARIREEARAEAKEPSARSNAEELEIQAREPIPITKKPLMFDASLAIWLQQQRWFAGRSLHDLAIVADTEVLAGDPALRHLIVLASHRATTDHYQILIGLRAELPDWLEQARIGTLDDGRHVYDALHDPALTRHLLHAIAGNQTIGALHFSRRSAALDSIVLPAEQSNTSLVFGEQSILKVLRRVSPSLTTDLEVTSALARLGSAYVAEPFGSIETRMEGVPTTLAILSRYLRTAIDGWTMASSSVFKADGFMGEAYRLGAATAEVHRDLAEAFGTGELSPDALHEVAEQMYRRFNLATEAAPELARHADMIGAAYSALAKINEPVPAQRVHGDYHLGQVMRTETGWIIRNFEGEPGNPLAQRRARSSPLRDVAAMLRSFDYAARFQLLTHPDTGGDRSAARKWIRQNSVGFCAGYAEAGGLDLAANEVLLRALQLDKAVYEVMYEAKHRPARLPIPLESLADFPTDFATLAAPTASGSLRRHQGR